MSSADAYQVGPIWSAFDAASTSSLVKHKGGVMVYSDNHEEREIRRRPIKNQ